MSMTKHQQLAEIQAQLRNNGFQPKATAEDGEPVLVKHGNTATFPYVARNMVDGEYITEGMGVTMELTADGNISLSIPDADYQEGPYSVFEEDGMGLLKDAMESR